MSVLAAISNVLYRDTYPREHPQQQRQCLVNGSGGACSFSPKTGSGYVAIDRKNGEYYKITKRDFRARCFWPNLSRPTSIEMEPIENNEQLDQIILHAQQLSQPVIIDWMAAWCRKCIYLKPRLEKLAAEYDTKLKFYYADVNKVPQAMVKRANISKMPTIQLWKDGEIKAEVIGGHKAWLVMDEVREMIQKFI